MKKPICHFKKVIRLVHFVFLISFILPLTVRGQNLEIKGKVINASTKEALSGVTVVQKGTTVGTLSDLDGNFSISVPNGATLSFSFIGMKGQEIRVINSDFLTVALEEEVLGLDEVIVTGYSTQRKADLTGSISVINVDNISTSNTGNVMRAAQGKVAGMSITSNGSPNPWATIRIRGEGTLNNNDPLFIVDGTPTTRSMGELASMDIESIQVL